MIKNKNSYFSILLSVFIAGILYLLVSCATHPDIGNEEPFWKDNDKKLIPEPEFKEPSLEWLSVDRTAFDPLLNLLDFKRNFRKLAGAPQPALNVNSLDEVPNSSWFENRHNHPYTRMTPEQIYRGNIITDGPETNGYWKVFRPKIGGTTPGFWIEDSKGDQYIVKFDPVGYSELATGAAVIGSRFFYACGYNVPQETIVYWNPKKLRIKEGAIYKDESGEEKPFTIEKLEQILDQIEHQPDGTIRSLASLSLGNVKGPFSYKGTRRDDPNDWCPHEHRRELRALYILGSLVNHYDLKDHNSMDVYIKEKNRGYLKHYLLDFGSILGSDGDKPKPPKKGYDHLFDLRDVGSSTFTLGLKKRDWKDAIPYQYNSIGYFESAIFKPNKFAPIYPNPAFENMTVQDAYWGAKTIMAFSNEDLKTLVSAAKYSDSISAQYMLEILIERRDKIGNYWFNKINPIDYPEVTFEKDDLILSFEDLLKKYNLDTNKVTYMYQIKINNNKILEKDLVDVNEIKVNKSELENLLPENHRINKESVIEFKVKSSRKSSKITPYTNFIFKVNFTTKKAKIIGIQHEG
jgi:hypothetical protein